MAKLIWWLDMVSAISQLTACAYLGVVFWDILALALVLGLGCLGIVFLALWIRQMGRRVSWAYVRATRIHPKEISA
ncbi:MAG: hypothetical protein AB1644_10205 [Candidatus Zixiibacteriota bacterium]